MEIPFYSTSMFEAIRRPSRAVLISAVLLVVLYAGCGGDTPRSADSTVGSRDTSTPSITSDPLRALGTEPFWALDIDSSGLRFITPDDTSGIRFPPVVPGAAGDTMVWSGATERGAFDLRIWREQCSDGMSDRVYPYAARLRVDSTTYSGCADRRQAIIPAPKNH